jgi:hypothetical protein
MNRITLAVSYLLFWTISIQAQDRTTTIDLNKAEPSLKTFAVPGAGVLFMQKASKDDKISSEGKGSYLEAKLHRINTQGEKIWEVNTGKQDVTTSFGVAFSSKLEYVFYVTGFYKKLSITQINPEGKVKKFEAKDLFGYSYGHVMFGTTKYFCFITRRHKYVDGAGKEVYTLNKWDNETLTPSNPTLELPDINKKEKFGNWFYYGNSEQAIYFISKCRARDKISLRLVALDFEGKLLSDNKIEFALNEYLELTGSTSPRLMNDAIFLETNDDIYGQLSVHLDSPNNALYTWGMGEWEDQKKSKGGYFLNKYNLAGQLEWTIQDNIPEPLIKQGFTKIIQRQALGSVLQVHYDQTTSLHVFAPGAIFTMEFLPDGDVRGVFSQKNLGIPSLGEVAFNFVGREESPAFQYLSKKMQTEAKNSALLDGEFYFFRFLDGELIAEVPKKSEALSLYWFKRN